jgi:TolA-binding protein
MLEAAKSVVRYFAVLAIAVALFHGCYSDPAQKDFEKAEQLLSSGESAEALRKYAYIANNFQASPSAPKSRYKMAFIYRNSLLDRKEAIETYKTLIFLYPQSAEAVSARKDLAKLYSEIGEYSKALAQEQWLYKQGYLNENQFKYMLAMHYVRINDFKQARIEFESLKSNAGDKEIVQEAYFQHASTYFLEGDSKKAIEAYDDVLSRFPTHKAALDMKFNKAKALEEFGKPLEALELLVSIRGAHPNKAVVDSSIEAIRDRLRNGGG